MNPLQRRLQPSVHAPGWQWLAAIAGLVVVVAVAWFTVGGSLSGSGDDNRGVYREAIVGKPDRVNPLFAHLNDADRDLSSLIFSGLTRLGQDGEVLPDLAERWEMSRGGASVTFHLRPGVVWHTGAPFSASDVVFTYSLLADPALQGDPDVAPLWRQVHCNAPNEATVICDLPAPFAPFLAYATVGILPKHILEGAGAAGIGDNSFNRHPVGTGPYRLAQLDESHAVLKANASYHLGAPKMGEVELLFFPDAPSAAAAIVRGEADGLFLDPVTSRAEVEELSSANGIKVYTANRTSYTVLYLNNGGGPFNEPPVRKAVALALETEELVGDVLGGAAVAATSPMVPGTWGFDPNIPAYEHDNEAARDLLDEAGWSLPEDGDVRRKGDVDLSISLVTDQDPVRGELADRIAEALKGIGMAVSVERQDSTALVKDFLIPRQYDAAIFGWDPGPDPDPYPAWHSSQTGDNGRNIAGFQDEDADSLMEQARRTSNLEERQSLYYTFQQVFHEDVPSLILYYPVYNYFVSDRVAGVELGTLFNTGSRFRNVFQWELQETVPIGNP